MPSPLLPLTWVGGCVHGGVVGGHLGGRGPAALTTTSSAASRPAGCVVGGGVGGGVVRCLGGGGGCVVGGSVGGVGGGVGGVGGCCSGGGLGVGGFGGGGGQLGLRQGRATRGLSLSGPPRARLGRRVPGSVGCLDLSPRPAALLNGDDSPGLDPLAALAAPSGISNLSLAAMARSLLLGGSPGGASSI